MSGLVSGLQNRVRRFESARNLRNAFIVTMRAFFVFMGSSKIEYISDKMIKWTIVDNAHEGVCSDPKLIYPAGTSLPTSTIFTRVE